MLKLKHTWKLKEHAFPLPVNLSFPVRRDLHHHLRISQRTVVTLDNDAAFKEPCFYRGKAGSADMYVHISTSGVCEPTCYCSTAEQTIIWVALSHPPPPCKPWTNSPIQSVSLILIYHWVMKHLNGANTRTNALTEKETDIKYALTIKHNRCM